MFDLLWSTYLCCRFAFVVLFCHYVCIVFIFLKAVYVAHSLFSQLQK